MTTDQKRNKYDYLFNIDFKKYYEILTKQKGFIMLFVGSAMVSALLLTYFFSEKYEAGVHIYYRPIETSLMRFKETQAFGSPVPSPPFKVIIQTLRDIVKSETVLIPVVERLHLDKKVQPHYDTWYEEYYNRTKDFIKETGSKIWTILKYGRLIDEDPKVKAVKDLRQNIKIIETKESYVYLLTVKDKYPARAAKIADVIGEVAVRWLKDQGTGLARDRINQLEEQLSEKEKDINLLRTQKENILKQNDIISIKQEYENGIKSLYDLETEQIRLSAEIQSDNTRIGAYRQKLKNGSGIDPDDYRELESKNLFDTFTLQGLESRLASLNQSIAQLKERLGKILSADKYVENIDMKLNANMREYIHLKDMYVENEAQLINSASEIKIMHKALIPSEPAQPIKIYYVALSGFLSLIFASGLVYIFAFFNIRIFFASYGVRARKTGERS